MIKNIIFRYIVLGAIINLGVQSTKAAMGMFVVMAERPQKHGKPNKKSG